MPPLSAVKSSNGVKAPSAIGLLATHTWVRQIAMPALLMMLGALRRNNDPVLLHDQRGWAQYGLDDRVQPRQAKQLEEHWFFLQQRPRQSGIPDGLQPRRAPETIGL